MFNVHFPKENVQHHILLCKMFSITFSKGKCSASLFFAKQKTQYFSAFAVPLHFVGAEHFPLENVQHHILLHKRLQMHFCITFSKGKCSAKQNVRKRAAQKTANTAFLHSHHAYTVLLSCNFLPYSIFYQRQSSHEVSFKNYSCHISFWPFS